MDAAYFSGLAALAGSVIGGLTSLDQRSVQIYADAFDHDHTELASLVRLFAMISQMRVVSSPRVVENAEGAARLIMETYVARPTSPFVTFESTLESHTVDPLRRFSEACREELQQLGAF
jgi:hypothetical protein